METKRADRPLILLTGTLCLFGTIMVYSASAVVAQNTAGSSYHFVLKHLAALAVGITLAWCLTRFDYLRLRHPIVVYGFLGLVVGLLVLVLFMPAVRSSHRWFRLGSFAFQPSELAKLAIIVFLAYLLEKKGDRVNDFSHTLLPALVVLTTVVVFVLQQPDLGTSLSIAVIAGIMLFLGGLSWKYVFGGLALAAPIVFKLAWMEPYRRARLEAFMSPWKDPLGSGFQPIQSLIALGSGGLSGLGPAQSRQKLFFLPEAHTDFIYAVIGEEYGFIGCVLVLVAFTFFLMRGIKIALGAREPFGFLVATGVTTMIVYQALVNISVVLSIVPTKGTPLPFMSAGGSSLVVCLAGVGLLLNISKRQ